MPVHGNPFPQFARGTPLEPSNKVEHFIAVGLSFAAGGNLCGGFVTCFRVAGSGYGYAR